MVWLGVLAKDLYREQIGFIMSDEVNWFAAILFYILFIAGIILFVVRPALDKKSWQQALFYGAIFGLITYATYDLTNLATLKGWPVQIVIYDLLWGSFITAVVGVSSYWIGRKIFA